MQMQWLKKQFYLRFRTSFAKAGEDLQVFQLLRNKPNGVYVDIGAHHPIKGSNTYFFYLRGWKGVCVDPNPDFKDLYKKLRPKDIFLNIGISDTKGRLNYYKLKGKLSVRNSFSKDYIDLNKLNEHVVEVIPIKIKTLKEVLKEELEGNQIDFLTVDVEGLDLQVLKGNDWKVYRPKIVCVETHSTLIEDLDSDLAKFMIKQNYVLFGKTMQGNEVGTLFFKPV